MKARIEFSWNQNIIPAKPWGELYIDGKRLIGRQGETFDDVEKQLLAIARQYDNLPEPPPAKEYEVQLPSNGEPVTLAEVLDHFNRTLR